MNVLEAKKAVDTYSEDLDSNDVLGIIKKVSGQKAVDGGPVRGSEVIPYYRDGARCCLECKEEIRQVRAVGFGSETKDECKCTRIFKRSFTRGWS